MSQLETLLKVLPILFNESTENETPQDLNKSNVFGSEMIGQYVIIRTYSAGVWFGLLDQKEKNEVILKNARRMWYWKAKESISLSAVAIYGINQEDSKIVKAVNLVWLEAIEIIPTTDVAHASIMGAKSVNAQ